MYQEEEVPDVELLSRLLDSGTLQEDEKTAFQEMLNSLTGGRFRKLTHKQRQWAEGVYQRLGLASEEGSANLYSRGIGHPLPGTESGKKYAFEGLPLPEKPPRRGFE